jgi:hypothetical protein
VASFVEIKPAAGPAVSVSAAVKMAIKANTIIHPSILVISPFGDVSRFVSRLIVKHV